MPTIAAPASSARDLSAGKRVGNARPLRRAVLRSVAVFATGSFVMFGAGFAGFVSSLDRFEREPPGRADGIVALTGGTGRIGDAIDLLARGYGDRLLITGVNERTSREEIARLNPHQRELVSCCVDLDYRARNTVGNAVETSGWTRRHAFGSLILVTSNYHVPRALLELNRSLPRARVIPFGVVTPSVATDEWWRRAATARLLLTEYAKYLGAYARSMVTPTLAAPPASEPLRMDPAMTSAVRPSRVLPLAPPRLATGSRAG